MRGDVRFDRLSRAIYSTDASLYQITPIGVVMPRDARDVTRVVDVCREFRVPIVPRGAGTGIAGGAVGWGLQLDFSRYMTGIIAIDPVARTARVEPGVVLDDLNARLAPYGLHFPPDVATSSRATIGGMIANNSCGAHSVYYGRTVDWVDSLTVVLTNGDTATWRHYPYDDLPPHAETTEDMADSRGAALDVDPPESPSAHDAANSETDLRNRTTRVAEIESALSRIARAELDETLRRYPRVLRRNGGYALDRLCLSQSVNPSTLICGSEGTLALVVEATLRLAPLPRHKGLLVLRFDSVLEAIAVTPRVLKHRPAAVELVDRLVLRAGASRVSAEVRKAFLVGDPAAVLICELYDDDATDLTRRLTALDAELRESSVGQPARMILDTATQAAVWGLRNLGFGLLMSRPGDRQPHEFIEDAAVDPSRLRDYIAELDALLRREGVSEVGYYAHASVGVIHVRPTLNLKQPADVARMRRIADGASSLALKYGGAFTGEHGDGIVRSEWLEKMYGPRITATFQQVKEAFDPGNLFNPRKIVAPLRMDERLRYANSSKPLPLMTQFDYGEHGDMAGLAGMCSGVGLCRQKLVGVMCPSYMATLDERHTTRARANALRVALSNNGLLDGLDDPALADAMDLCLSCKACKSECPTGVDMAKLKAEWLSRRNERFGAPLSARFIAAAPTLARLGSRVRGLSNALLQSPVTRAALEVVFGVDRRVAPPRFAKQTFREWLKARKQPTPVGASQARQRPRVIYFVDTWMNYYWPEVGVAATRLLEADGYEVITPELRCCGRPLISKGFLADARRAAEENVARLAPLLDDATWIVGSEPSCVLTLMDEYPALLRNDVAKRVASRIRLVEQVMSRDLETRAMAAPLLADAQARQVLYHSHCHQKALVGADAALALLQHLPGVATRAINSGCCGMAGSFGHEAEHYEVARAVGEQRLFPAVRERQDAEIVVSGFSCREQIAHHTGARPRHLLEIAAERLLGSNSQFA